MHHARGWLIFFNNCHYYIICKSIDRYLQLPILFINTKNIGFRWGGHVYTDGQFMLIYSKKPSQYLK